MAVTVAPAVVAPRTVAPFAHDQSIPILDFGSQYAQRIARSVREAGVYSELVRPTITPDELRRMNAKRIIVSGGRSTG